MNQPKYLTIQDNKELIDISNNEILELRTKIIESYESFLKNFGVKPLWNNQDEINKTITVDKLNAKELQLIFLTKYKGNIIHKDLISAFVRKIKKDVGLDQQVRHLSSQYGWYILNKGDKIPDTNIKIPSGYHFLVSLETPNPKIVFTTLKRIGRLGAKTFEELKAAYNNKCATCGIRDNEKDPRLGGTLVCLQQGHMDPRKELSLENTIPQCQYCNQIYKDYFQFNEYGRVISVSNPEILLKSSRDIQERAVQILLDSLKITE